MCFHAPVRPHPILSGCPGDDLLVTIENSVDLVARGARLSIFPMTDAYPGTSLFKGSYRVSTREVRVGRQKLCLPVHFLPEDPAMQDLAAPVIDEHRRLRTARATVDMVCDSFLLADRLQEVMGRIKRLREELPGARIQTSFDIIWPREVIPTPDLDLNTRAAGIAGCNINSRREFASCVFFWLRWTARTTEERSERRATRCRRSGATIHASWSSASAAWPRRKAASPANTTSPAAGARASFKSIGGTCSPVVLTHTA